MIEERYETLDDASPHEEYLLVLSESGRCFGYDFSDLAYEIKDRIVGDKLSVQEYFHPLAEVDNSSRMIQNSVWLIHWEECLKNEDYPCLELLLDPSVFPDYAAAIICTEEGGRQEAKKIERQFKRTSVAYSRDTLFASAKIHFADINPTNTRGKQKIKSWNNEVCGRLGI